MNNLKSILFSLMAITMVTVFLSSCEKGEEAVTESQKQFSDADNQRIMNAICANYDDCEGNVEFTEDAIILEGDMVMEKADFLQYLDSSDSELGERQRIYTSTRYARHVDNDGQAPHNNHVTDVTFYVMPSATNAACAGGWITALDAAAAEINALSNCKLNFRRVNSINEAHLITVACDTDYSYWNSLLDDYIRSVLLCTNFYIQLELATQTKLQGIV